MTILVADDFPEIRTTLRLFLEAEGYHVLVASDGAEAIRILDTQKPRIVITDILMPEKDGIEVIREVKNRFPDVGTIAISGGGEVLESVDLLSTAKYLGADRIFAKPLDLKAVVDSIRELLD